MAALTGERGTCLSALHCPPPLLPSPRPLCAAHSIVSAFTSAQFEWQAVTDQFPAKAARQARVTGQEGI
uniref:Uncharacterized protein n=1 Tax=Knipowitschia caucasica TaxID=637954 RepID=A0AAV2MB33_KNICA